MIRLYYIGILMLIVSVIVAQTEMQILNNDFNKLKNKLKIKEVSNVILGSCYWKGEPYHVGDIQKWGKIMGEYMRMHSCKLTTSNPIIGASYDCPTGATSSCKFERSKEIKLILESVRKWQIDTSIGSNGIVNFKADVNYELTDKYEKVIKDTETSQIDMSPGKSCTEITLVAMIECIGEFKTNTIESSANWVSGNCLNKMCNSVIGRFEPKKIIIPYTTEFGSSVLLKRCINLNSNTLYKESLSTDFKNNNCGNICNINKETIESLYLLSKEDYKQGCLHS
jgi:hypothetical protein